MPPELVKALAENAKLYAAHDAIVKEVISSAPHRKAKKQRWDREKYNANAARCMRERRAKKRVIQ